MSRVASSAVPVPSGLQVTVNGQTITIKGSKGNLQHSFHPAVIVEQQESGLWFKPNKGMPNAEACAGTERALVKNMLQGVSKGFEKQLELRGVGYRAQVQGKVLNLAIGFSHPVNFPIPAGIIIETPSQTEVIIKGVDRQLVGQVAANIRSKRPPECYKGKGIRYKNEVVVMKEGKKK